jgi:hypothetical protein
MGDPIDDMFFNTYRSKGAWLTSIYSLSRPSQMKFRRTFKIHQIDAMRTRKTHEKKKIWLLTCKGTLPCRIRTQKHKRKFDIADYSYLEHEMFHPAQRN